MNEVILTSLLFFIKSCLNQSILRNCNISESCRVHFGILDSSVLPVPNLFKRAHYNFFLAVHSLLVSGYGLNLFQLRHAQLINMAGTAPKPASAKTHSTAIATQDLLTSANARMATSIRHFAKQVTPHFFQNFPYQIFFNYFLQQKKFFFGKKTPDLACVQGSLSALCVRQESRVIDIATDCLNCVCGKY